MSGANIVHSGYGLRCEKLDKPLNLGWGLDNSAVLHWPGELPTGWLCDALDQIFIAAPQLQQWFFPGPNGVRTTGADAFRTGTKRHYPSFRFLAVTVMAEFSGKPASGKMVFDAEREIYFPQRPPVRRVKFIVVTIHAFAGC